MKNEIAESRPEDVIRLDEFCSPDVRAWIDGANVELNRLEIQFPSEKVKLESLARLLRESIRNRHETVKFILDVLEK
jgi:hypothetical protein